jgi:hypothetical protein
MKGNSRRYSVRNGGGGPSQLNEGFLQKNWTMPVTDAPPNETPLTLLMKRLMADLKRAEELVNKSSAAVDLLEKQLQAGTKLITR